MCEWANQRVGKRFNGWSVCMCMCVCVLWSDSMVVFSISLVHKIVCLFQNNNKNFFGYDTIGLRVRQSMCFEARMQTLLFAVFMCVYAFFCWYWCWWASQRGREENEEFVCVWVRFISFLFIFSLFNLLLGCFLFLLLHRLSPLFPFYHSTRKLLPLVIFDMCCFLVLLRPLLLRCFRVKEKKSRYFFGARFDLCIHFAYQAIIYCGSLDCGVCASRSSFLFHFVQNLILEKQTHLRSDVCMCVWGL